MPKRLSFQLYTARNFSPLTKTLEMVAGVGFKEVEGYGGVFSDPKALRADLDRLGLTMPTGHIAIEMLEDAQKEVVQIASTLGIRHIYAPYIPEDQRPATAAGWKKLGQRLHRIGEWVRSEGYTFGWHNHDFEFRKLASGVTPHEILFDTAPMLDWECDVAWVAKAKVNPVTWIKRYAGRITSAHIKDIARKGEGLDEEGWADVGHGVLNWPAVFAALKSSRVLHYVLEHDNPTDLNRFAKRSFDFAKGI